MKWCTTSYRSPSRVARHLKSGVQRRRSKYIPILSFGASRLGGEGERSGKVLPGNLSNAPE